MAAPVSPHGCWHTGHTALICSQLSMHSRWKKCIHLCCLRSIVNRVALDVNKWGDDDG